MITIPFIILAVIIILALISIPAFKLKQEEFKRTGKHPKGHYMGLGIAMGLPIGLPIGIAMGNIALGPALGMALGIAIGAGLEKKHAHELRPLTEREQKLQIKLVLIGLFFLVLGIVVFFIVGNLDKQQSVEPAANISVTNFQDCVAAGNPVMESYPRQCRHDGVTYVEELDQPIVPPEPIGMEGACEVSKDCELPMEYAVRSSCPFQAYCKQHRCVVGCPMWREKAEDETSGEYRVACAEHEDCNCHLWDQQDEYPCQCLDEQCVSVVEAD